MATATPSPLDLPQLTFAKYETSPTIGQLFDALAKAHKVYKPVIKDMENPFFKSKYSSLAAVIDATKDGLSDNGLAIVQAPVTSFIPHDDARAFMITVQTITTLGHCSGEWIRAYLELTVNKSDAQGIGSAITYSRRYAYSSMAGVASEEDDDANAAVSKPYQKKESKESKETNESNDEFDQRTEGERNLAVFQIQAIDQAIKRTGKTEEEVLAYLGLIGENRIEHLKRNQFQEFLKWANSKEKPAAKPKPEPKADPKANDRTQANKRLWATAAECDIPENDIKRFAYEKYGVDSMTELSAAQLSETTQWVKDVAALK